MNLKWQHNAARNFLRSSVVTWLQRKCANSQKRIFATPLKDRNYRCSSNHFQLWRYQTAMGCPHEPPAVPSCALSIPGGIRLAQDLPIPPSLSPFPAQSLLALTPFGLGHIQPGRLNLSLQTSLAGWERETEGHFQPHSGDWQSRDVFTPSSSSHSFCSVHARVYP